MHPLDLHGNVPAHGEHWDTAYEWRAVALLSLGFGCVMFDRFLIVPMFPTIMRDLKLSYADLGVISGALAITWGASSFVMGRLADRFGRRPIIVWSMVAFSLMVGASGFAAGAASLIAIRAAMGFAEGAYIPPSLAATLEASEPRRVGLTLGLYQVAAPLLGFGVAPILVTQLLAVMDWRLIFLILPAPGLLLAFLLSRTLREPAQVAEVSQVSKAAAGATMRALRHRNVIIAVIGMVCWLNCLIVLSAFLPSYLLDSLHFPMRTMGFVMSAIGFGAVVGAVAVPALSDRIGRKPAAVASAFGAICALVTVAAQHAPAGLFCALLLLAFCIYALLSLTVGTLAMESVPVELRATASGLVVALGELFGGGLSPVLAGYIAHSAGLWWIFPLAGGGLAIGALACLALIETAPARMRRASSNASPLRSSARTEIVVGTDTI